MKKIFYMLFTVTLFLTLAYPQEKDSLIRLYPGMGDTLHFIDREIFGLYPDIDGFEYAQLFSRDRKYLISKVSFSSYDRFVDTVIVENISRLFELHSQLLQFEIDNDKKFESPPDATVFTNSGNNFDGRLEIFSKKFLYLQSDLNYFTNSSSPFRFKTPITKVDSLSITVKKNMFPYVGGGALVGFLGGFIIGTATAKTDWPFKKEVTWFITGGIGLATGALIGWLIGESLPPDFVNIRFNTPYDITKLKDYSAFYFHYNKAIEDNYVELD